MAGNGSIYIKFHVAEIRKAVKERGVKPIIALTKNPAILRKIATKALDIVNEYVPEDSGALRESGHVVYHEKQFQLVWSTEYAHYQYTGIVYRPNFYIPNVGWRSPKGKGTKYATDVALTYNVGKDHWTDEIKRGTAGFEELVDYAEPLVKKEVK